MNNLLTRALTGLVFVASIILSIWFNVYSAIVVFLIYYLLSIFEFSNLFKGHQVINFNKIGFVSFLIFPIILALISFNFTYHLGYFLFLIPALFILILTELWRNKANPIFNLSVSIFGIFYLLVPFGLIFILLSLNTQANILLIGMFLLIWTNDTFAYLTGRFIGKTKLFERISPNKTWEGTIGGIVFTIIVSVLLGLNTNGQGMLFWIVSAAIIAPAAIVGDLFESLIKRNLNIKDSGNILPGHGGILDRFDATLMAVPFYFTWVYMYQLFF